MSASALICAGQGAQRAGGLADLPPSAKSVFDQASDLIGEDLWRIGISQDPADEHRLRQPSLLQPYLVAWSAAEWRAALEQGVAPPPDCVAGHSSGTNSALVLSGAVPFAEAVRFARLAGRNMDAACADQPGGLLALVGAGRDEALRICDASGARFANANAPDQTVLGGRGGALARAEAAAEAAGCQTIRLRVAGAFHTPAFRESDAANESLIDQLPIADSFTPIIGNRCGQLIETPAQLRDELRGQYTRPVEWLAVLETLRDRGVRTFITLGPGNAMAGLVRRFRRAAGADVRALRPLQHVK